MRLFQLLRGYSRIFESREKSGLYSPAKVQFQFAPSKTCDIFVIFPQNEQAKWVQALYSTSITLIKAIQWAHGIMIIFRSSNLYFSGRVSIIPK